MATQVGPCTDAKWCAHAYCHFLWVLCTTVQAFKSLVKAVVPRLRPYHVENTSSRPITEVKQRRARLVLGWVTAWEYRVL